MRRFNNRRFDNFANLQKWYIPTQLNVKYSFILWSNTITSSLINKIVKVYADQAGRIFIYLFRMANALCLKYTWTMFLSSYL